MAMKEILLWCPNGTPSNYNGYRSRHRYPFHPKAHVGSCENCKKRICRVGWTGTTGWNDLTQLFDGYWITRYQIEEWP